MKFLLSIVLLLALAAGAFLGADRLMRGPDIPDHHEIVAASLEGPLAGAISDDVLDAKVTRPLEFEEGTLSTEKFGDYDVNLSQAVIGLDLDPIDPEKEPPLAKLYPSFRAAADAAGKVADEAPQAVLVSSSMLYAKSRTFDDGLLAALEVALMTGKNDFNLSAFEIYKQLFAKLAQTDAARGYISAALELAGEKVEIFPEEITRRNTWLNAYRTRTLEAAPPTEFYTWTPQLKRIHDFERFLQDEIAARYRFMTGQLARALKSDEVLLKRFEGLVQRLEWVYRPRSIFTLVDIAKLPVISDDKLMEMFRNRADLKSGIVGLPHGIRREQMYVIEMLPLGVMTELDLLPELLQRSTIGFSNVLSSSYRGDRPGIEEAQAFALDAFLTEKRTNEADKLLLTRVFRERLIQPFFAVPQEVVDLATVRQPEPWSPSDAARCHPHLRIEPTPAYYLRVARNYKGIPKYLEDIIGPQTAATFKRLTPTGEASEPAMEEIKRMTRLFYGLYLVCCEDLGVRPSLESSDDLDREACYREAVDWLKVAMDDPVFAEDARYLVPVDGRTVSQTEIRILSWGCIGVRLAKLETTFARPPQLRDTTSSQNLWRPAESPEMGPGHYLLPVYEMTGLELRSRYTIPPEKFREICDKGGTREEIAKAMSAVEPPASGAFKPEEEAAKMKAQQEKASPAPPGRPTGIPEATIPRPADPSLAPGVPKN